MKSSSLTQAIFTVWTMSITFCYTVSGQLPIIDDWRMSVRRPGAGWEKPGFDDAGWSVAQGGFGTRETPGARIQTVWATKNIWLRKSISLESVPANPALLIHHDEDIEVYINGETVFERQGFLHDYQVFKLNQLHRSKIKVGENLIAVHCRQSVGGQFVDVHLIDGDRVPELPAPPRSLRPFQSELMTTWGKNVSEENVWSEYPRPQMRRGSWKNLNGLWDYAISDENQSDFPDEWEGQILVPFSLESKLGGVQRLLDASEALWYRRVFDIKAPASGKRMLLNFEAVDYQCQVYVNRKPAGSHTGGNTPFTFDITGYLIDGDNEIVVRVEDKTEEFQLRGKQTLNPRGIWYTQVSGIWQTVWMEEVADTYLKDIKISASAAEASLSVMVHTEGPKQGHRTRLVVRDGGNIVGLAEQSSPEAALKVNLPKNTAKFWSPSNPHLYDLTIDLRDETGNLVDSVHSYAGLRDVRKLRDSQGHWRFTLNGDTLFHWGPLDQGWWPDGLLTPPADDAMVWEITRLKNAGFNMIRKHIKVEPRRYYYHCDRLGMMVWQDQVSGGPKPNWTRLALNPDDAQWPDSEHRQFMAELDAMIGSLENHPSIVSWVPFNEAWGQHRTMDVGQWTQKRDPSRIINIASGGNFWPVGDVVDAHNYPHPDFPFDQGENGRFDNYIKVMGEFGGHGFPVQGHLWDPSRRNWGYGDIPKDIAELKERYVESIQRLNALRPQGIAAGVYTQTTDVEGEINGLMTYDRKVIKIPAEELAGIHRSLFSPLNQSSTGNNADSIFNEQPTDRIPGQVMNPAEIKTGLREHNRALYIKSGWIRDPYITLGPDNLYYLTGTQTREGDPAEGSNPYNIGLGDQSIVGHQVRVWQSSDLIEWKSLGVIFTVDDTIQALEGQPLINRYIWAPEIHWLGDKWALVHCPGPHASLALTSGESLAGPWTHAMGNRLGRRHDPSIFMDDDGSKYLLWGNTLVAPLSENLSQYTGKPVRIDPAGSRPGPDGKFIRRIGHEGATMIKVGGKYVHFGTAWSTDNMRKGSYNLYYCVADNIYGPYGPRKFAGRFLGHGTPFKDKEGKWWCTAFFNANVPPLSRDGIRSRDLAENAQTINEQGVTIVPMDIQVLDNGDIHIQAKDPDYANPGPDEAQNFK